MRQCLIVLGLVVAGSAALAADKDKGSDEVLARWAYGHGKLAEKISRENAAVIAGVDVEADDDNPVRLELTGFPFGQIILGAGAKLTLGHEPIAGSDEKRLAIDLRRGVIQVDIDGTGPYQTIMVRGGPAEIKVTGTSFLFERVKIDPNYLMDYVAVIEGNLKVGMPKELAERVKQSPVVLQSKQGIFVHGNLPFALSSFDQLNKRPTIPLTADSYPGTLYDQGIADITDDSDGGWDIDLASRATHGGRPGDEQQVETPPVAETPVVVEPPAVPAPVDEAPHREPAFEPMLSRGPKSPNSSVRYSPKLRPRSAVMDELTGSVFTGSPLGQPLRSP
jgi:hypothetical protein